MTDLVIEVLGYLAATALLGFLLGYLVWGWKAAERIAAARAEGAREARTSVDGDSGLRAQLDSSTAERARLEEELDRLTERIAELEGGARSGPLPADASSTGARGGGAPAATSPLSVAVDASVVPEASAGAPNPASPKPSRAPQPAKRERAVRRSRRGASSPQVAAAPLDTEAGGEKRESLDQTGPAPDLSLRRRIMAQTDADGTGEQAPPGDARRAGDDAAADDAPPQLAAFSLRRRRQQEREQPPVADERSPSDPDGPPAGEVPPRLRLRREPRWEEAPQGHGVGEAALPAQSAGGAGPADMPEPPEVTAAHQSRPVGDQPPVADQQVPPGSAGARESVQATAMPVPADFTRRQQHDPAPDEAPVVDEQVPSGPGSSGGAGAQAGAELPRPPGATLARQHQPDAAEPPVVDEQVHPSRDEDAPPDAADHDVVPQPPAYTRRRQPLLEAEDTPVVDEQVQPDAERTGTPEGATSEEAPRRFASTTGGAPVTGKPSTSAAVPVQGDGSAESGLRRPATLLESAPADPDNLRAIRGVGRSMERQLNRRGIWLYRQLAGLQPDEVEWLVRDLGPAGERLRLDGVVEQARELDRGKTGQAPTLGGD